MNLTPALMTRLAQLDATLAQQEPTHTEPSHERADRLFAHIVWSRISEPGDGMAGTLLAAVGASRALQLLEHTPSPKTLVATLADAGTEVGTRAAEDALARWVPRLDRETSEKDISHAHRNGLRVLLPGDHCWPTGFTDLGLHAPIILWLRGDPTHLRAPSLSVVGARAVTGYGTQVTTELVHGLVTAGLTIVSGAAYGVDAAAHRTALAAEAPTIAVLAGGVDRPYPRAHESLLNRISVSGTVCTEMVPGSAPTKWRFLQRNRLIAALSHATLVTEAGVNSGSLNTAGHAAQLGRSIGAVPGPVTSAASAGCHKLIREYDATLITSVRDARELAGVNDELDFFGGAVPGALERESSEHRRVCDALPLRGTRELADIARRAGLAPELTRGVLVELELLGRVTRQDPHGGASPRWALNR